jgi:hypothetical protein
MIFLQEKRYKKKKERERERKKEERRKKELGKVYFSPENGPEF